MKYQHLISAAILGAATAVSASPLAVREETGHCPAGYTMSTYVVTVFATPSATPVPETTVTPTSPAMVVHSQVPTGPESSTPEGDAGVSVSSTSTPALTPETAVPDTTQAVVAITSSSTESSAVITIAPTSTSVSEESTSSQTSTSTSSAQPVSISSNTLSSGTSGGEATYYGGNLAGGTCSFSGYTLPSSLFGTALSADAWDDAAKCGACVAVTGPSGNTIKAMVSLFQHASCRFTCHPSVFSACLLRPIYPIEMKRTKLT